MGPGRLRVDSSSSGFLDVCGVSCVILHVVRLMSRKRSDRSFSTNCSAEKYINCRTANKHNWNFMSLHHVTAFNRRSNACRRRRWDGQKVEIADSVASNAVPCCRHAGAQHPPPCASQWRRARSSVGLLTRHTVRTRGSSCRPNPWRAQQSVQRPDVRRRRTAVRTAAPTPRCFRVHHVARRFLYYNDVGVKSHNRKEGVRATAHD